MDGFAGNYHAICSRMAKRKWFRSESSLIGRVLILTRGPGVRFGSRVPALPETGSFPRRKCGKPHRLSVSAHLGGIPEAETSVGVRYRSGARRRGRVIPAAGAGSRVAPSRASLPRAASRRAVIFLSTPRTMRVYRAASPEHPDYGPPRPGCDLQDAHRRARRLVDRQS